MAKHLNTLEKEFLIRQYKDGRQKLSDFCEKNGISTGAFQKWMKQYEEGGIEGLARADAKMPDVLPEGIDRTEEAYKREILKLRIENERLKKNYTVQTNEAGKLFLTGTIIGKILRHSSDYFLANRRKNSSLIVGKVFRHSSEKFFANRRKKSCFIRLDGVY